MNIQVAVLCDAATDDNGKLNLLGAFDTIYTQQLPAVHPQCSIALRVTFASADEGLSLIHISEPTRLLSISYAVFCLKKKKSNISITSVTLTVQNKQHR